MALSESSLLALTVAIQPARRAWVQAAGLALADSGLSVSLAFVVVVVSRLGPGVQQKVLADEIGINPAGLVRMLDQGEAAGLLLRRQVKGNRRIKVVDLLPAGEKIADDLENALARLRSEMFEGLPLEDVLTATRVLRVLESKAAAYAKGPHPK